MSLAFSRRMLKQAIALAVVLGLAWAGHFGSRVWQFETLFAPEKIADNFRNMHRLFYTNLIRKSAPVQDSVTPRTAFLQPGHKLYQGIPALGYAYQFWIPYGEEGEFMAIGVYGQFIYVNPMRRVVIAKNSAYLNYNVDGELMEYEAIEAFPAIARFTSVH